MKLLLGMVVVTSPGTDFTGIIGSNYISTSKLISNPNAFAYSAGVGLRFEVSNTVFFILQADYFGARPKFNTASVFPDPLNTLTSSNTSTQSISTLSFGICFAYRIN